MKTLLFGQKRYTSGADRGPPLPYPYLETIQRQKCHKSVYIYLINESKEQLLPMENTELDFYPRSTPGRLRN